MSISENPWEAFDSYDPASFWGKESTLVQRTNILVPGEDMEDPPESDDRELRH